MAKVQSELKKLKLMSPMSAEATVVRNFIETLINLPWRKKTRISKILPRPARCSTRTTGAGEGQGTDHRVSRRAAARRSSLKAPILCLVGPPGVGKTSLGQSIATATGRKFVRMSLGGVRDEAEIRGHRRTYIGSMPGKILQNMTKVAVKNPLFLLDEVDKMGQDFRGDPSSALLEVLDPEQNSTFVDHYVEVEYDLSEVMFVATANTMNIPAPLLDRMEVIRLVRLYRRREGQHRAALSRAQADEDQRPQEERADRRRKRACATSFATTPVKPACARWNARFRRSAARSSKTLLLKKSQSKLASVRATSTSSSACGVTASAWPNVKTRSVR